MWKSRNKNDLIIEVWEKLDCESVGATEIEAIEIAVAGAFGPQAVESPMRIARMLADEGAELRHSEIMQLYLERAASDRPHDTILDGILDSTDLSSTLRSIRRMENARARFVSEGDREGGRRLRELAVAEKSRLLSRAAKETVAAERRAEAYEAAEWIRLWLQAPALFENWVELRRASTDFVSKFGKIE